MLHPELESWAAWLTVEHCMLGYVVSEDHSCIKEDGAERQSAGLALELLVSYQCGPGLSKAWAPPLQNTDEKYVPTQV